MKKIDSIKSRLIMWLIPPIIFLALLIFFFLNYILTDKINSFFDNRLYAIAKSMEKNLDIKDDKLSIDFSNFSIDLLSKDEDGMLYYSIVDEDKRTIIGWDNLVDYSLDKSKHSISYNKEYFGQAIRVLTTKTFIVGPNKNYIAYVSIAESLEQRNDEIMQMTYYTMAIMLFVTIFMITIMLLAIQKSLNPLHKLKLIINKRDKRDLSPINLSTPKEIEDAVMSLNILLQRSRENIEYIEHFNADVSHQLKTPLAEIRVKIEENYPKSNKEYKSLINLVDSMAHLVEQLLLYSKSNPNNIDIKKFQKIDVKSFIKNYSLKIVPKIYKKGFEFEFENIEYDRFIYADSILLESMLDNLINNSLYYAVDKNNKPMGIISIKVKELNNKIQIIVRDQGCGIKKEHLKDIFKRKFSADTKKSGNGLGLNIVKQIATLHQAKIEVQNNKGLEVSIIFP